MGKFITHIRPPSGFSLGLKELWQYRELFYFFTWRDIKVKYKQTLLGITWALLQPLGMMIIFTFIFSRTLKIETGSIPYPVFVLTGLVLWGFFSSAVSHAAESMIQHANIIKKIYFPRLIIPCSAILTAFFDFLMSLVILVVLFIWYLQPLSFTALFYFPAGIILICIAAFGFGTFLAALNIKFRDFRYVVPFLLQVMFFTSQVVYPLATIQQEWLRYYFLLTRSMAPSNYSGHH
jgi:lipopolysaccharide transport system permease protein